MKDRLFKKKEEKQKPKASWMTVTLPDAFEIIARINTGYGNAVFISGGHHTIGEWKYCYRLENISEDMWKIRLHPHVYQLEFCFYIGEWDKGVCPSINGLIRSRNLSFSTDSSQEFALEYGDDGWHKIKAHSYHRFRY